MAIALVGGSAAASQNFVITPANNGLGRFGYIPGTYGALSPANFRGKQITQLNSPDVADLWLAFAVDVTGTFSYIQVVDTAGLTRVYTAASGILGGGIFAWGTGSNRVYTGTTARDVTIV